MNIYERQKQREREKAKEEWEEMKLEEKRMDALEMLEEMKKAKSKEVKQ
jgi:hypothetical protein